MIETWGTRYSSLYDLLYKDKDYRKETDFLERIFDEFGKPRSILELGSGTGNYTQILENRGYQITGLDMSDSMIEVARRKCSARFLKSDIRNFHLAEQFDSCIAMFAVIGYLTSNSDLLLTFRAVRKQLKNGGLFIFDVWNGLSVMRHLPEIRVKEISTDEINIIRCAFPRLRPSEHLCEVDYRLLIINRLTNFVEDVREMHTVRFFFPQELSHYLEEAGFRVERICPFMKLGEEVEMESWNMTIVARAQELV